MTYCNKCNDSNHCTQGAIETKKGADKTEHAYVCDVSVCLCESEQY